LVTKKIVKDGQNQEIIETSGYNVKEWLHFVDCISFLSNLLKWILRATNSGAASLVFSDTQWESMFGLMQDPQLTMLFLIELQTSFVAFISMWRDLLSPKAGIMMRNLF
jgi:hypothetical protein